MNSRFIPKLLPIACLAGFSLVGFIAWFVCQGESTPSPISTSFLGYTNGATGPLGMFAVSNSSAKAYLVVGYYAIQVSQTKGRGAWVRGTNAAGAFLPPQDCRTVTVPAAAQVPWRASLTCCLDRSGDMTAKSMFLAQAAEMGVPTRYRIFQVWSDWITK